MKICKKRILAQDFDMMYLWSNSGLLRMYLTAIYIISVTVVAASSEVCSKDCVCSGPTNARRVDCSNMNLTTVPRDVDASAVNLDISWNVIRELSAEAFTGLSHLQELHLSSNRLHKLDPESFNSLVNLKKLSLDGNQLMHVPVSALAPLYRLEALNLAANKIQEIPNHAFKTLRNLVILILQNNKLEKVEEHGFEGLVSLKVLEINGNRLTELPKAISSLPLLQELTFADNEITFLDSNSFQSNKLLVLLELSGNPIYSIEKTTFSNLPHLKKLTLSNARLLEHFPNLSGTSSLEHLRLDRARIASVPSNLCEMVPMLRSLNLKSNQLSSIPHLNGCTHLRLIDLSYNMVTSLDDEPFKYQKNLIDLFLNHNQIRIINEKDLKGLTSLQVLDLESNEIEDIHPDAFSHCKEIRDLNLGANRFPRLPTKGLRNVRELKTFNNRELKDFPPIESFPRVNSLALSYAYHCCAFTFVGPDAKISQTPLQETIVWLTKDDIDMTSWNANITDMWLGYENFSSKFEEFAGQLWKHFGRDYALPDNYPEEYFEESKSNFFGTESSTVVDKHAVQCLPEPGPFMPCVDLFGWWSLRCGVWVVFLLALLGNGVVVIVLLVGRSKMDVPRFLVSNLAVADFFMGVYLGMLAVVDASTLGEFKVSAIKWQTSPGCQIAGFLAVLSSELSVFTLSVITLERNYAITHAMHLNKRLSLRHAGYIMFAGWTFAGVMATLPLFGVSDYRKFAICLPFETEDVISLSYVVFLILINGVAFLILMGCYLKMYCTIRGSQAWNSNDSRIAKRMALLVVTDFICWAPIAFFSLAAITGAELISLEQAKVFAIFVLPMNSCANPFLYAIFTKQFKKDCIHICKRIEESRVTRGIGRGRHSSNFSNLHAPIGANLGGIAAPFLATSSENSHDKNVNPENEVCSCGLSWKPPETTSKNWKLWALKYLLCQTNGSKESAKNSLTFAFAKVQRRNDRQNKHASSISSENFSSRSDSWRQVNIPMRLMHRDTGKCSWKFQRKASQDSNASCSRQDSSTSTFRMSHSSFSSDASNQHKPWCPSHSAAIVPNCEKECHVAIGRDGKPKLCRQSAVEEAQGAKRSIKLYHSSQECPESSKFHNEKHGERPCTFCSRSNAPGFTIIYKSEDSEHKIQCFHNKQSGTLDDNNDLCFLKEEKQHLLESATAPRNCGIHSDKTSDCSNCCSSETIIPKHQPDIPTGSKTASDVNENRRGAENAELNSSSNICDISSYDSCNTMIPQFQKTANRVDSSEKCRSLINISQTQSSGNETVSVSTSSLAGHTLPARKSYNSSQRMLSRDSEQKDPPRMNEQWQRFQELSLHKKRTVPTHTHDTKISSAGPLITGVNESNTSTAERTDS